VSWVDIADSKDGEECGEEIERKEKQPAFVACLQKGYQVHSGDERIDNYEG